LEVPPTPTLMDPPLVPSPPPPCIAADEDEDDNLAGSLLHKLEIMTRTVTTLDRQTCSTPDEGLSHQPLQQARDVEMPATSAGKLNLQDAAGKHHMCIEVMKCLGLSIEATLILKIGDFRRQATVAALQQRPVRIPAMPGAGAQPCAVKILSTLSSTSLVLHPGKQNYRTRLQWAGGKAAAAVEVTARGHRGSSLKALGAQGAEQVTREVNEYLAEHHLLQYVPALLQAVIQEHAEDPYGYMSARIKELLEGALPGRAVPPSGADGVELAVRITEKLPEGSLVSVRLGNERKQTRAAAPGDEMKMRFSVSALAPLKIAVLVPEASEKLLIVDDKTHYSLRLNSKEGKDIELDLAMQMQPAAAEEATHRSAAADAVEPDAADGSQYLERHRLVTFAHDLVKGLAEKRPADPYQFALEELYSHMRPEN